MAGIKRKRGLPAKNKAPVKSPTLAGLKRAIEEKDIPVNVSKALKELAVITVK